MSPFNPLFAVACYAVAILVALQVSRRFPLPEGSHRAISIDGLRGYLAFGVFVCHGANWFNLTHCGSWYANTSRVYAHLGSTGVALFFMITAFLFAGKLIDEQSRPIAWNKFFIGRLFRIVPLYLIMILALLGCVVWATGGNAFEPLRRIVREATVWAALAVHGMPDINGYTDTVFVVAGVPWTLRYEIIFYAALPLIATVMRRQVSLAWIGTSAAGAALLWWTSDSLVWSLFAAFAVGFVAAYAHRSERVTRFASSRVATVVIIGSAFAGLLLSESGLRIRSIALFGISFVLIAAGNDLFGLLRTRASRFLGEISYGIYLFHGLVLYLTFRVFIGSTATTFTVLQHWSTVLLAAPFVLLFAAIGHLWIEKPGIERGRRVAKIMSRGDAPALAGRK